MGGQNVVPSPQHLLTCALPTALTLQTPWLREKKLRFPTVWDPSTSPTSSYSGA